MKILVNKFREDVKLPFRAHYNDAGADVYIDKENSFVYPCSAFSIEIYKNIKTNKITITFNLPNGGNINEIVILGKK